jgi:glucose dehydrogenase
MWGATVFDQMLCRIEFKKRRYQGQFTAPSVEGSIGYPDIFGVFNWGSVAIDPEREIMFVNPTWLPYLTRLIPRSEADANGIVPFGIKSEHAANPAGLHAAGYVYPQTGTPYASSAGPFVSQLGFPCHRPPWGEVAAVDLKTEKVLWRRPFGTTRDAAPLGLSLPLGVFSLGGAVVTRGGVAFIGAAIDNYIRAFDLRTGAELWRARLPAGGQATPMSYVAANGRQYVVIAAGGHASMKTTRGDYVMAYSLDKKGE